MNTLQKFLFVFDRIDNPSLFFKFNDKTNLVLDSLKVKYAWKSYGPNNHIILDLVKNYSFETPQRIVILCPDTHISEINNDRIEQLFNILNK